MKIAICDDEACLIDQLREEITAYAIQRNLEISIDSFPNTDALYPVCKNYDILFLDIRFNGENVGITWAEALRAEGNNILIVMYSSLKEEAINAFHAEAIRFIPKPLSKSDVYDALDVCCKKLAANDKQIIIKSYFDDVLITMADIVYIESTQRHRKIVLSNKLQIETNEALKSIYDKLDKKRFAYCHKSYIVQIHKVRRIEQYTLYLTNGGCIPLSRNLVSKFRSAILTYAEDKCD